VTDAISPERRSENMRAIRSKGMKPEMTVRRLAHGMGYRYRLHRKDLPGKPDLTFPARRKVIFIHGCFWHQHDDPHCPITRKPKSNRDYWLLKLERNVQRDSQHYEDLERTGWSVMVIWECQLKDRDALTGRIAEFLG